MFDDAVTCSGAQFAEGVHKPPILCTKNGGLTLIDPSFRNEQVSIFRTPWPLEVDCNATQLAIGLLSMQQTKVNHIDKYYRNLETYDGSNTQMA